MIGVSAAAASLRLALSVVLGFLAAFLVLTWAADAPTTVLLVAVTASILALLVTNRGAAAALGRSCVVAPHRGGAPAPRAGRATDAPRHPLRPRAPGVV